MASRRSLTQYAVGLATSGLPFPVRDVLSSRWGAPATIVLLAVLISTGVIVFDLTNGKPNISLDKQRAQEVGAKVKDTVRDTVQHAAENWKSTDSGGWFTNSGQGPESPATGSRTPAAPAREPWPTGETPRRAESFGGENAPPAVRPYARVTRREFAPRPFVPPEPTADDNRDWRPSERSKQYRDPYSPSGVSPRWR